MNLGTISVSLLWVVLVARLRWALCRGSPEILEFGPQVDIDDQSPILL